MADALALVQALPPPLLDQQTVTLYFIVLERSESLVRLVADVSYGLRAHQRNPSASRSPCAPCRVSCDDCGGRVAGGCACGSSLGGVTCDVSSSSLWVFFNRGVRTWSTRLGLSAFGVSPVGNTLRFDFRVPSSLDSGSCGVFTAQTEKTAVDLRVHGSEGARDAPKALFEDVEQAARLRLGRYLEPRRLAAQAVGGRNVLLAR